MIFPRPNRRLPALLVPLVALAGCQAAGVPNGSLAVSRGAAPAVAGNASVPTASARVVKDAPPNDGMAHATVVLNVYDDRPLAQAFRLLAIPGTWTPASNGAKLVINDTNVLTGPLAVNIASFTGAASPYSAVVNLPALRPDNAYTSQIYLQDTAGAIATTRLAGSITQTGQTLQAGANTWTYTITVNANEATYDVASSSSNNVVTGNNIVAGDKVFLDTGIMASQPGVAAVNAYLTGTAAPGPTCYTPSATRVFLGQTTTAGSFNTFQWDTTASPALPGAPYTVAGGAFVAGSFAGPASGTTTNSGQIDFEAVDVNNNLVGKSSFALAVFGKPSLTVQVQ